MMGGSSHGGVAAGGRRTYTHVDYIREAEECLLIEDEMDWLEEEDPECVCVCV